jgi:hypothetical protein
MLLHNKWVIEEIREEIKKFKESNEKENTTYQNLCTVLRGMFIVMSAYIKNTKRSQINDQQRERDKKNKTKIK